MQKMIVLLLCCLFVGCALWDKYKDEVPDIINLPEDTEEPAEAFPESVPNNGPDFSTWKQTVTIGNLQWKSPGIRWEHIVEGNRNVWKEFGGDLNGHLVAMVQDGNGVWNQCLIDSIRPKKYVNGYDFQTLKPFQSHGNKLKGSLKGWSAKKGEKIGIFLVNGGWGYPGSGSGERSNVLWTEYPY